jgi:hypothetical protein
VPVMIKDGRSVLFIHIPKTGGTSVERLFKKSGWEQHLPEMIADLNTRFDLGLRTTVKHHLKSDQRGLSSSSVEVSPELRTLLHEVYAEDFSRLDYPTT